MNKKLVLLSGLILSATIITGCVKAPATQETTDNNQPMQEETPEISSYSMEEVAMHDSKEDCWTTINNEVYDLTAWIGSHPGGMEQIIQLCGTDGSDLFNNQHGNFAQAKDKLTEFKIGTLDN